MALEENLRQESVDACLHAAHGAEDALKKLHENADNLGALAARLASLADTLASDSEKKDILLSFPRSVLTEQKQLD